MTSKTSFEYPVYVVEPASSNDAMMWGSNYSNKNNSGKSITTELFCPPIFKDITVWCMMYGVVNRFASYNLSINSISAAHFISYLNCSQMEFCFVEWCEGIGKNNILDSWRCRIHLLGQDVCFKMMPVQWCFLSIWYKYTYLMFIKLCVHMIVLIALCKTAVSPLLTHWRYCSLALSHGYGAVWRRWCILGSYIAIN